MTSDELIAVVSAAIGDVAQIDASFGTVTLDIPARHWVEVAGVLRDDPLARYGFFDWLSAYDDKDAGLAVVAHLWSMAHGESVIMRTHVPSVRGRLPTLTTVWAGAAWHERETAEMFGIEFGGHPDPTPLLLPDGFEGNPLRKDFVLASRVAKVWPGIKEPGESDTDLAAGGIPSGRRRRGLPPGVPDPGTWGPA